MKTEMAPDAMREDARHGNVFLPVNNYHSLIPVTYRELALHWHEEMEITLIEDGTSDYRVAGDVPHEERRHHSRPALLRSLGVRDTGKDHDFGQSGVSSGLSGCEGAGSVRLKISAADGRRAAAGADEDL